MNFKRKAPAADRQKGTSQLGTDSSTRPTKKREATGFESNSSATGSPIKMGGVPAGIDPDPLLEGMDYELEDRVLFNLYSDIYFHDPIAGCTVDMYSTLPFSEFTIGGGTEKDLQPYKEAVELLQLRTAFPEITVDYKVSGAFLGSLIYNKQEKSFVDLMTHRYADAEVKPLPFYSQDPIINLTIPDDIKKTLQMDSPRIRALRERLGGQFLEHILGGSVELDPLGTIYVPRKQFTFDRGVSYFRRILPIWLIEKNLYRGTLIESGKRQRGILHLQMGDGEQWEPTQEDMEYITDLFMNADADPLGAVVATRLGVSIDEFRQGGDFWKITDIWDQTTTFKLRALGVSEAFLSGDASYSTMEGSLTVFVESMRTFRDMMTRRIMYDKIFPLVSMLNGKAVSRKGKVISKQGMMDGGVENVLRTMNDGSKLFIPTVHWSKQLKPEGDQAYMDILRTMQEAGIPVPLRAMAAAGGFNLDTLLSQQAEDLALQKSLHEYEKRVKDMKKEYGGAGGEGGDEGGFGGFSAAGNQFNSISGNKGVSRVLNGRKQRSLLSRDFGERSEITGHTKTGKKKYIRNQKMANEKANNNIYKAMRSISKNKMTALTHSLKTGHE